jgi:hypothetical protein
MGEVTREDRIAALRALRYSEVSISIAGEWVDVGGDVFSHVDGSKHGYVEENSVALAIASARAAGRRELVEAFRSCEHKSIRTVEAYDGNDIESCEACGAYRSMFVYTWTLPGLLDGEAGR